VPKTAYVSRPQRELTYGSNEPTLLSVVGEVRVVEQDYNTYVFC
jgi:hypothetical protein